MTAGDDLRRRRDAALRLPRLDDGRRDPLDGHDVVYTKKGVLTAVEHFRSLGMLDPFLEAELRTQWWRAS